MGRNWGNRRAGKGVILAVGVLLLARPAQGGSGAQFLKIDAGARPAALGGAYTALSKDALALRYNPAGLAQARTRELALTHARWLVGSNFDFAGFAQPTEFGTFGLGMTRLGSGSMESRGSDRRPASGAFEASDLALALGFGRGLKGSVAEVSVGGSVKFVTSRIGSEEASTGAVDLGAGYKFAGRPLALGLSVLNVGPGLKFRDQRDPLPTALSAGAGYTVAGGVTMALDVRQDLAHPRTEVSGGMEYQFHPSLALRMGYSSELARFRDRELSILGGLGGGFGLKLFRFQADYAFAPFGPLGDVHRFSFGARF